MDFLTIGSTIFALPLGVAAGIQAIATSYDTAIKAIFKALVLDPSGGSIYTAIITPCKTLAGAGFMYSMRPLLKADLHQLKHDGNKIFFTFLLVLMFINGGALGRAIGIGNYAVINGINDAIKVQLEFVAKINQKLLDMGADKATIGKITTKLDECSKITRNLADNTPNPLYTTCETELRSQITAAQFKNPDLGARVLASLSSGDIIGVGAAVTNAVIGFPGWVGQQAANALMAVPQAIFDACKAIVGVIAQFGFALALTIMPIPLALSIVYPAPLQAWFAGLWSLGVFQWSLTILSGAFLILNSTLGGSLPLFFTEITSAFFAPAIAGALAAGGAFGIYKLAEQAGQAVVGSVTKIISHI
ncbi:hypothetical protein [Chamaesiphon sp.]|uniref:hypothetical protein n=1 Tax=Chamaesiphon sp. TaxID=2814140 RepID=UPI0035946630